LRSLLLQSVQIGCALFGTILLPIMLCSTTGIEVLFNKCRVFTTVVPLKIYSYSPTKRSSKNALYGAIVFFCRTIVKLSLPTAYCQVPVNLLYQYLKSRFQQRHY